MTVYSFAPISTPSARILVLGSMPGEKSLAAEQYYAHPQNSFWLIMSEIFDMPVKTYAQKTELIRHNDLALWDVLKACIRPGSLDHAIDKQSVVPNDFSHFLKDHPQVRHILFNGGAAHDFFRRHVWQTWPAILKDKITLEKLPSTSPAMASLTRAAKTRIWADAIRRVQAPRNHRADGV